MTALSGKYDLSDLQKGGPSSIASSPPSILLVLEPTVVSAH
jgi:hypothetical protein